MRRLFGLLAAALVLTGCGAASDHGAATPARSSTAAATDAHADWKTHARAGYVVRVPPHYIDDMSTVRSLASTQELPAALIDAYRRQIQETPVIDLLALADTDRSSGESVPTLLSISVVDHRRPVTPDRLEQHDLEAYRSAAYHGYLTLVSHRQVKLPAGTAIEWRSLARWKGDVRFASVQYAFARGNREYAIIVTAPANQLSWARSEAWSIAATLQLA
jgi:hypothetical protein